jgi:hypothetical protein
MQRQYAQTLKNEICIRKSENGEKSASKPKWKWMWIIPKFI